MIDAYIAEHPLQPAAEAILKIVDAENPPSRFFVGTEGFPVAGAGHASRLATRAEAVSRPMLRKQTVSTREE